MLLARASHAAAHPRRLLYVGASPRSPLLVSEDAEGRRWLQFGWDGPPQSLVWPGRPLRLELPYAQAMAAGLAFVPEPQRLLVVGVGGGALPMFLREVLPEAHIDAVDVNAEVLEVARCYFGLREDARLRTHVADGRRFIEAPGPAYDAVFLDAYGARSIPRHLVTAEFLAAVQARLAPGGVVVSNVWTAPNPLFPAMFRTYQERFARLFIHDVAETANRIIVGLPPGGRLSRRALKARVGRLAWERGVPFDLRARVARPWRGDEAAAPALRDTRG
jgi:spermidine synthase